MPVLTSQLMERKYRVVAGMIGIMSRGPETHAVALFQGEVVCN
jgi:hypothetical protein